jgi:ammonia channel protein AmtB
MRPRLMGAAVSVGAVLFHASQAWSAEPAKIDSGDTAWMLTSAALVLMMTAPGLALFYGGLVRSKNVLNLLMQSFIMIALISVQWVLWGYSLAFGPDHAHVVGGLDWLGGETGLLLTQVAAVLVTYGIAIVGTLVCLGVAGALTGGIRVDEDAEFAGLDLSQHSESAYVLAATGAGGYESVTGAAAER